MQLKEVSVLVAAAVLAWAVPSAATPPTEHWIGAFAAPPIGWEPGAPKVTLDRPLHDETVRQIVRVGAEGTALRVHLTNELNAKPLRIGAATIARMDMRGGIVPGSIRPLTFGGRTDATIEAGARLVSDGIEGKVTAGNDYAVSLYLPGESMLPGRPQPIDLAAGDQTGSATLDGAVRLRGPGIVSAVDVWDAGHHHVLVAFGDSITEGAGSIRRGSWPEQLAQHLGPSCWSVVNAGISANRLLAAGRGPSALARFDRDALGVAGVDTIVLLEGINDIGTAHYGRPGEAVTAKDLIAGQKKLIARAHAKGVRIIGATLTPFEGAAYADADGEAKRQALNEWIRHGDAFDAVIDFDAAVRDPAHPARMAASAESGDHLHPGNEGYRLMAAAAEAAIRPIGCPAN